MLKCLSTCWKLKLDPFPSPCTKLKWKLIKDINIKPENLTLPYKKLGRNLEDIDVGEEFLNKIQIAQEILQTKL